MQAHFLTTPNPDTEAHRKEVLRSYLKSKGVATEQKFINGEAQELIWIEV